VSRPPSGGRRLGSTVCSRPSSCLFFEQRRAQKSGYRFGELNPRTLDYVRALIEAISERVSSKPGGGRPRFDPGLSRCRVARALPDPGAVDPVARRRHTGCFWAKEGDELRSKLAENLPPRQKPELRSEPRSPSDPEPSLDRLVLFAVLANPATTTGRKSPTCKDEELSHATHRPAIPQSVRHATLDAFALVA
jgi:hypothetical protein